jgi:hypothetical protein
LLRLERITKCRLAKTFKKRLRRSEKTENVLKSKNHEFSFTGFRVQKTNQGARVLQLQTKLILF